MLYFFIKIGKEYYSYNNIQKFFILNIQKITEDNKTLGFTTETFISYDFYLNIKKFITTIKNKITLLIYIDKEFDGDNLHTILLPYQDILNFGIVNAGIYAYTIQ